MNRLASILPPAQVLVSVDATSKKRAFEEAGLLFENLHGLSPRPDHRQPVRPRAPRLHRPGPRRGHPARPHQGPEGADGRGVPAAPADRLRRARRAAGRPADLPAGARSGDAEAPGDPVRDRRAAVATRRCASRSSPAPTRPSCTQLIATWQSAQPSPEPRRSRRVRARMKPTVVSADVLFEDHRAAAASGNGSPASAPPSAASTRSAVRAARSGADLVGYLNYIHPYRVQILGEREVAYLTNATRRGLRAPHLAHRHAGAAGAGADRRPDARPTRCCRCASARRSRCSPPHESVGLRDRRAARLPVQALRRAHLDARRVHGHPGPGRADHRRVGPGQERAGAGADLARQRPGGRRRGRPVPHQPDHHRGPLPRAAAEPAGGARHRPARHPGDLRRDGGAPQDAAEADRAPGAARDAGARLRAPAATSR